MNGQKTESRRCLTLFDKSTRSTRYFVQIQAHVERFVVKMEFVCVILAFATIHKIHSVSVMIVTNIQLLTPLTLTPDLFTRIYLLEIISFSVSLVLKN